jgi:hypothetical protein
MNERGRKILEGGCNVHAANLLRQIIQMLVTPENERVTTAREWNRSPFGLVQRQGVRHFSVHLWLFYRRREGSLRDVMLFRCLPGLVPP